MDFNTACNEEKIASKNNQIASTSGQIDPNAKNVKAYLYKIKMPVTNQSPDNNNDCFELTDEIFLPDLGACVNFSTNTTNVFEAKHRRNDVLEYEELESPVEISDMEYYDHAEIEIPIHFCNKITQILNMKKQINKNVDDMSNLKAFMMCSKDTKTKYTNPMFLDKNTTMKSDCNKSAEKKSETN